MKKYGINKNVMLVLMAYLLVNTILPNEAMAQMIDSTVNRGADYIIGRLGPSLFLFGIAVSGGALALGNMDWVKRGVYVLAGGIIVLSSHAIFNAVSSFAR